MNGTLSRPVLISGQRIGKLPPDARLSTRE
jgi:hypothetical protein